MNEVRKHVHDNSAAAYFYMHYDYIRTRYTNYILHSKQNLLAISWYRRR